MAEVQNWRKEFGLSNFTFHYNGHFNAFIRPIFESINPFRFVIYKLLICIYVLIWFILSIVYNNDYNFLFTDQIQNATSLNDVVEQYANLTLNSTLYSFIVIGNQTFYLCVYQPHFWIYYYTNQIYLLVVFYFMLSTFILVCIYFHYMKVIDLKSELLDCCCCFCFCRNPNLVKVKEPEIVKITSLASVAAADSIKHQSQGPAAAAAIGHQVTLIEASASWANHSNILSYPKAFVNLIWFIYTAIVPLSFTVSLLFIHDELRDSKVFQNKFYAPDSQMYSSTGQPLDKPDRRIIDILLAVNFNLVSTLLIIIEFLLSIIPIRIFHFYIPVLYLPIYSIILLCCYWLDSSNFHLVYSNITELDFSEGSIWIFIIVLVFIVILLHLCHALAYRLKIWLYYRVFKFKNLVPLTNNYNNNNN